MDPSSLTSPFVLVLACGAAACGQTITNPPPPDSTGFDGSTGTATTDDAGDGDGDVDTGGDGDGTSGDGDGTTGDGTSGDGDGTSGDGDGTTGDGTCALEPTADTCAACCATDHAVGFNIFDGAFSACGCFGPEDCYGTCSSTGSLCGPGGPPAGACLTCAESALAAGGGRDGDAAFDTTCLQDADCAAFVACLDGC